MALVITIRGHLTSAACAASPNAKAPLFRIAAGRIELEQFHAPSICFPQPRAAPAVSLSSRTGDVLLLTVFLPA